mmetsp:Transcript_35739/g.57852  ORF Transcript_35739/g.57852 Transcript_35739/m.57852 type:complete len:239 (-) Transcript_35739:104-820(-)
MMQLGDDCGGSNSCGSWFSTMKCKGTCCHDDFNAWCCPTSDASAWECKPTFQHDASHCNAPLSCTCTKNDYQIISIKTTGKPQIKSATQQHFKVCCPKGASSCGVSNSVEWSQTQTLSWSSSLTESIELSTELEIAKFGITLSGTYTNGGSTTRTVKSSVTVPCKSTTSGFDKLKLVDLSSTSSVYTIPITMTATHCGAEVEMPGTVAATTIDGTWDCEFRDCKGPCDNVSGCSTSYL